MGCFRTGRAFQEVNGVEKPDEKSGSDPTCKWHSKTRTKLEMEVGNLKSKFIDEKKIEEIRIQNPKSGALNLKP